MKKLFITTLFLIIATVQANAHEQTENLSISTASTITAECAAYFTFMETALEKIGEIETANKFREYSVLLLTVSIEMQTALAKSVEIAKRDTVIFYEKFYKNMVKNYSDSEEEFSKLSKHYTPNCTFIYHRFSEATK